MLFWLVSSGDGSFHSHQTLSRESWTTGVPLGTPIDANTWSRTGKYQSKKTSLARPVAMCQTGCPDRQAVTPIVLPAPLDVDRHGYQSVRKSYPGATSGCVGRKFVPPAWTMLQCGYGRGCKSAKMSLISDRLTELQLPRGSSILATLPSPLAR